MAVIHMYIPIGNVERKHGAIGTDIMETVDLSRLLGGTDWLTIASL